MKIFISELKEWYYSEWEPEWYVESQDDNFSFDVWLENTKEISISTNQLNSMIFLYHENGTERSASRDFSQWKSKQDFEFVKVPKCLVDKIKTIINDYKK